jgi:pimeloyl-ACP methyl ester carboxylesterase
VSSSIYRSEAAEQLIKRSYRRVLDAWPVAIVRRIVPTREGDTHVVVCGPADAPPLVLLHGTMANAAIWMRDAAKWSISFRVYCVDIIGDAGLSAPVRPRLDSEAHALWLDDVLSVLAPNRAAFVGVSLGACIALDYTIRRPNRVTSLVLMCPGGISENKNILLWALPLLLLGGFGARKVLQRILGPVAKESVDANRDVSDLMLLIFRSMRPRTEKFPIFGDAELSHLRAPMMVLLGEMDVTMDSTAIRDRVQLVLPNAEIRLVPGAGHYLGEQSASILEFLRSRSPSEI